MHPPRSPGLRRVPLTRAGGPGPNATLSEMPLHARLPLAGFTLAGAHAAAAAFSIAVLKSVELALFFGLCAGLTAVLTLVARPLLEPPESGGPEHDGGVTGPTPPPWWPEFERDFWSHVHGEGSPSQRTHA